MKMADKYFPAVTTALWGLMISCSVMNVNGIQLTVSNTERLLLNESNFSVPDMSATSVVFCVALSQERDHLPSNSTRLCSENVKIGIQGVCSLQ